MKSCRFLALHLLCAMMCGRVRAAEQGWRWWWHPEPCPPSAFTPTSAADEGYRKPPAIWSVSPVIQSDSPDARKTAAGPMSWG